MAEIIGSQIPPPPSHSLHFVHTSHKEQTPMEKEVKSKVTVYDVGTTKLEEIRSFSSNKDNITPQDKERLIEVYKKYRHVFSDKPGKAKYFKCKLQFREN
ncbi:MAG: hypothetical protein ACTS77_02990, partial [Arsenophonus sp. NC-TX2-MAG3]